jgi:hypothetical protein
MFYSTQILSRKGPLGIIWIAASMGDKKLKRQQIHETSISETVGACLTLVTVAPPFLISSVPPLFFPIPMQEDALSQLGSPPFFPSRFSFS